MKYEGIQPLEYCLEQEQNVPENRKTLVGKAKCCTLMFLDRFLFHGNKKGGKSVESKSFHGMVFRDVGRVPLNLIH